MKRIFKAIFVISLLNVIFCKGVFAEIPNGTVVLGDKAFSIEYMNNNRYMKEIVNSVMKSNGVIYIKTSGGQWLNNDAHIIDKSIIPTVMYKNKDGNVTKYSKGDGDVDSEYYNKVITFKDYELEDLVRERINKHTGDITVKDVKDITILDNDWGDISSLEGIKYLTNLRKLRLRGGSINDISELSNLTNLQYLNLAYNYVGDISPLMNLTYLSELDLVANPIKNTKLLEKMNIYNVYLDQL